MTMITVRGSCPMCKRSWELDVPASGFSSWKAGVFIQRALPSLTADQRELLTSGICSPCWDKLFKE